MKIKVMRGIPGSGKSTLAKKLASTEPDALIVSADDFFIQRGNGTYMFDPKFLGDAHAFCMQKYIQAICREESSFIVVDNTNINLEDIAPYIAIGEAYCCEVEVVQVNTDPEVAASRNVHGVSKKKVLEMAERLKFTRLPRRWNVTVVNP